MKTVGAYRRGDVPYVVLCNTSPPIFRRALDPRGTRSKVSLAVTIILAIVGGIDAHYRRQLSTNRFDGALFFGFFFGVYISPFIRPFLYIDIFVIFLRSFHVTNRQYQGYFSLITRYFEEREREKLHIKILIH